MSRWKGTPDGAERRSLENWIREMCDFKWGKKTGWNSDWPLLHLSKTQTFDKEQMKKAPLLTRATPSPSSSLQIHITKTHIGVKKPQCFIAFTSCLEFRAYELWGGDYDVCIQVVLIGRKNGQCEQCFIVFTFFCVINDRKFILLGKLGFLIWKKKM